MDRFDVIVVGAGAAGRIAKSAKPSGSAPPFLPFLLLARSPAHDAEIDVGIMLGQALNPKSSSWEAFPLVRLLKARSTGRVRINAADAEATLDIDHAHLGQQADLNVLCEGVELAFALLESPDFATILEPVPGSREAPRHRAELRNWLRSGSERCSTRQARAGSGPTVLLAASSTARAALMSRLPAGRRRLDLPVHSAGHDPLPDRRRCREARGRDRQAASRSFIWRVMKPARVRRATICRC
jgi:hypothetical protein